MKAKTGCNERRWKGRKKKQNLAEQAILQESQTKSVYIHSNMVSKRCKIYKGACIKRGRFLHRMTSRMRMEKNEELWWCVENWKFDFHFTRIHVNVVFITGVLVMKNDTQSIRRPCGGDLPCSEGKMKGFVVVMGYGDGQMLRNCLVDVNLQYYQGAPPVPWSLTARSQPVWSTKPTLKAVKRSK